MALVHASCVAVDGSGVLLLGPPGSGKSDLALRLVDGGAVLVADDQVDIRAVAGRLEAAPPAALAGRIEVRGLGILALDWRESAPLRLAVELLVDRRPERLPAPAQRRFQGIALPLVPPPRAPPRPRRAPLPGHRPAADPARPVRCLRGRQGQACRARRRGR